jgi:hypothetical protein
VITKEALKQLVGVAVVVHLHGPWWVVKSRNGAPDTVHTAVKDENDKPVYEADGKTPVGRPMMLPILPGTFVEHDGELWFQYKDWFCNDKIEVLLNLADVLSVTRVVASRIVT